MVLTFTGLLQMFSAACMSCLHQGDRRPEKTHQETFRCPQHPQLQLRIQKAVPGNFSKTSRSVGNRGHRKNDLRFFVV